MRIVPGMTSLVLVQGSIPAAGHLPFFLHLESYYPPPGTKIEAIPHPGTQTAPFHKKTEIFITFYKIDVDSYGSKGQETSLP